MSYLSNRLVDEVIQDPERFVAVAEEAAAAGRELTEEERKSLILARVTLTVRESQERCLSALQNIDLSLGVLQQQIRSGETLNPAEINSLKATRRMLRRFLRHETAPLSGGSS